MNEQKQKDLDNKHVNDDIILDEAVQFNRPTGDAILIASQSACVFRPLYVSDDHKGYYSYGKQKKEVDIGIDGKPKVAYMDISMFLGTGIFFRMRFKLLMIFASILRIPWFSRFVFNLYGIEKDGEGTISVVQDPTDDYIEQLKIKREMQLKVGHMAGKAKIAEYLTRGQSTFAETWKLILAFLIAIVLIVGMFAFNGGV